jgi:hypothetical protein
MIIIIISIINRYGDFSVVEFYGVNEMRRFFDVDDFVFGGCGWFAFLGGTRKSKEK